MDISKYHTDKDFIGTYASYPKFPNTYYITFLDKTRVRYCDQVKQCKEGKVLKIGNNNVYNFIFDDETIHAVYYEDEILLIFEDFASIFYKVSNIIIM